MQLHVAVVAGKGAEAFKLAPVIGALRRRLGVETSLILSGEQAQARDVFADAGIAIESDLAIDGDRPDFCAAFDAALTALLPRLAADLLLVLGDSDTAWVAAHVANRIAIPIGHIEAGLRSGHLELPWPEERNREEIDSMAALLLTPCAKATRAVADLPGLIRETGSSGVDALRIRAETEGPAARLPLRHILVAGLRRDAAPKMARLKPTLLAIATRRDIVVDWAGAGDAVAQHLRRIAGATLLLTDDGHLQEMAAILGIPTLMLRLTTERWDAVECGQTRIVGADPARLRTEIERLLDDPAHHAAMARPCPAYGDGHAADRIAEAVAAWAAPMSRSGAIVTPEALPALPLAASLL